MDALEHVKNLTKKPGKNKVKKSKVAKVSQDVVDELEGFLAVEAQATTYPVNNPEANPSYWTIVAVDETEIEATNIHTLEVFNGTRADFAAMVLAEPLTLSMPI